jgi:hypothetical protein
MFTVKKIPLTANTLWDEKNKKPLCKFNKGILETNDVELVEKLKELGYEVTGESDEVIDESEPDASPDESETNVDSESDEDAKPKRRSRKTADK